MSVHYDPPAPLKHKFLTPGVYVMLTLMAIGAGFAIYRFLFGLGAVTNLDNQHPWGIWIGVDVASGVALAAGGFTTAAIAEIFHRKQFHAVLRPALLTAMLGYTFVAIGLLADLGRYYNIWHPAWPTMWSGNSVLFEVAMCVMAYMTVLYIEFLPLVVERFKDKVKFPGGLKVFNKLTESLLGIVDSVLPKIMWIFVILGITLSCMHQSSLGALWIIAPSKVHPLWYTDVLPLLFLLSAFSLGYPMVMFESMIMSWSVKKKPEMEILTPLAKFVPVTLGIYLTFKIGDMIQRESFRYINGSSESIMFLIEVVGFVIIPFILFLIPRVRRSPVALFVASTMVVVGVLLNRINTYLVAYNPPYATKAYYPAIGELAITIGLAAALFFFYRVVVTIFPVLPKSFSDEA